MKARPLLMLLLLVYGTAHADQPIIVKDGAAVDLRISRTEPTRIRVAGARIRDVVGNIYSSSCAKPGAGAAAGTALGIGDAGAVNPGGDFVLGCDLAKGEIYIRPVGQGDKPFSIFVSTDAATYSLKIQRSDQAADTVVLQDQTAPRQRAQPGAVARQAPHVASIKQMLLRLSGTLDSADTEVELVGQPVYLWDQSRLVHQRQLRWRGLLGEHYVLTNAGAAPIVVAEQEFYRRDGDVVGVAVESHNLLPGQSTAVYVIRREQ